MNSINWHPGVFAKGLVDQNDDVHVFDEEEYPYHSSYIDANPGMDAQAYFYVDEEGGIELTYPNPNYDDPEKVSSAMYKIIKADPHFFKIDSEFGFA